MNFQSGGAGSPSIHEINPLNSSYLVALKSKNLFGI